MTQETDGQLTSLDVNEPIWERFFTLAPIVLVGTQEPDGKPDIAPKHLAIPMSWDNYFGFDCTPTNETYTNVQRSRTHARSRCCTPASRLPRAVVTAAGSRC